MEYLSVRKEEKKSRGTVFLSVRKELDYSNVKTNV